MIRVLRVIEYTYDTEEDYLRDRMNWTLRSPMLTHGRHAGMSMQSAEVSVTFEKENNAN